MAKKKPTKKKAEATNAVAFEDSLESLRKILADLEQGNLPLSESLEKYEAGIRHLRNCNEALQKAKSRIEMLVGIDKDGKPVTQPFEHSAAAEENAEVSEEEEEELNEELEDAVDDADWDGGLF